MSTTKAADPFMAKADDYIAKLAAKHDYGVIDDCEVKVCTSITYTFERGVSVKVWQGPDGSLRHKVFDGGI